MTDRERFEAHFGDLSAVHPKIVDALRDGWQAALQSAGRQEPAGYLFTPHNEFLRPEDVEVDMFKSDPHLYVPLYAAPPAERADDKNTPAAAIPEREDAPAVVPKSTEKPHADDKARQDRIMALADEYARFGAWTGGKPVLDDEHRIALEREVRKP